MSLIDRLFAPFARSGPDPRDALRPLYDAVIGEARDTAWYRDGGVADSVAGRFDMVCAALSAALLRLERGGLVAESALLTELFVHDMDGQLREFGVGDIVVGKRMGKLMSAMGGRLDAYRSGLAGDDGALADAVRRNVTFTEAGDPHAVAQRLRAWAARLAATRDEALLAGGIQA